MAAPDEFKATIQTYLENRSKEDPLFAANYAKPGKNIDDCITYIISQVKASGRNGFTDDEVYGMAVHYYDEDNIKPGKPVKCKVVVNHAIELSPEEKEQARQAAIKRAQEEAYAAIKKKPAKKREVEDNQQMSLFE